MNRLSFFVILISIAFLASCNQETASDRRNRDNRGDYLESAQNDSVQALHRAIKSFKESAISSKDSISRYNLGAINDSCIKFLYSVYGKKRLKTSDSLSVFQCAIKLTGFNSNDSIYTLGYTLFTQDTIPVLADLTEGAMIHTLEYSKRHNKLVKAYLGQHDSYMPEEDLHKLYPKSSN